MTERYYPGKLPPRKATYEDKLQKELFDAAHGAAVAYIKELLKADGSRLLRTLSRTEMSVLVESILAAYISRRGEVEAQDAATVFDPLEFVV